MSEAYIVSSVRSAIGKAGRGQLKDQRPDEITAQVIRGALDKAPGLPYDLIEDVILGCAFPEGEQGFNIGRNVVFLAGLPQSVSGMVLNRFCSSGLQAIVTAANAIAQNNIDAAIAGGVEWMSRIPMGGATFFPSSKLLGINEEVYWNMGVTAEAVAEEFSVSRQDQEEFALQSHQKALQAIASGRFIDEIVPVTVSRTILKGTTPTDVSLQFKTDEGPRADTSLPALAKLPTVFKMKNGTVTAGTASQVSDGAAATVLVSGELVKQYGLTPLARVVSYATAGIRPGIMGVAPIEAIPKALKKAGLSLNDIGLIELNEAFASQSLAIIRELGLNPEILNVNGGAIALGHPLGCTGARMTATILAEMQKRNVRYGLVTMCIGGGMGAAAVLENLLYH